MVPTLPDRAADGIMSGWRPGSGLAPVVARVIALSRYRPPRPVVRQLHDPLVEFMPGATVKRPPAG
ncbi:hypothetical protein ACFVUB_07935 [Streptomyces niveus]|uniref:hypothetical protein n=1 Tax=Streptomyces niveus TaxID=193462 RepID=UPI0036D993E5